MVLFLSRTAAAPQDNKRGGFPRHVYLTTHARWIQCLILEKSKPNQANAALFRRKRPGRSPESRKLLEIRRMIIPWFLVSFFYFCVYLNLRQGRIDTAMNGTEGGMRQ